jgi:hypothetical protein
MMNKVKTSKIYRTYPFVSTQMTTKTKKRGDMKCQGEGVDFFIGWTSRYLLRKT